MFGIEDVQMQKASFRQSTGEVLMIRPCSFGYNPQTAANNAFQKKGCENQAQERALAEFDAYVELLRSEGVKVDVVEDTPQPHTPDSIFPNNWFSTHSDGTLVLYPMFAPNRRQERKSGVMDFLISNLDVCNIIDLTGFEAKKQYLEGTGSMVIDRVGGVVFACRSPRTSEKVLEEFCKPFGWRYVLFSAYDGKGGAIYHTNVMMCIGTSLAVVCLDSITDASEREKVVSELKHLGKQIVEISTEQMGCFAGNMLELNANGQPLLVMSATAKNALKLNQIQQIESKCKIVAPHLETIEANGGGSARCMLAEIFIDH